ncbi:flagellar basal body rod protein FlgB [Saccharothrix violaceirubra]|uniref:Flagellar basal body rod protein FlgB n=1 Tax=Saccharothrix violaceirubra TaxID=413306 RepID=A0A7W7WYL9_9PSEU|nr:flagellar basal body rod protein FlgB [Saccharothrix violaceirubra]MBB4968357.1 flagellar basal-body rod protein FlgB [Saccharothrix violaceirubra]
MFDDVASYAVRNALTGLASRQRVYANNIANIETPGFTAGRVDFEDTLRRAVASGDTSAKVTPHYSTSTLAARQDGNNVNLDEETMAATKAGLQYKLALRAMDDRYGLVSTVLKGVR